MSKALLLIDIQNDFIDAPDFKGSLAVPGAYEDTLRTAEYIKANINKIDMIFKTVDTHNVFDIAHPQWWINEKGEHPAPFTAITHDDVVNGTWKAIKPELQEHSLAYTKKLEESNKYTLFIWPNHCIKNTYGWEISSLIKDVLAQWEKVNDKKVEYIYKGMNPKTEHYSGLKAEVVLSEDPSTELNISAIAKLDKFDEIEVAGQALSHCVAATTSDLINNIANPSKVSVLTDCCSNVYGCSEMGDSFLKFAQSKGANLKNVQAKPTLKM